MMTLKEFCNFHSLSPTHPTTEMGAVSVIVDMVIDAKGRPTPIAKGLYNLSDYVVRSRDGIVFWLVPRKPVA